MTVLFAVSCSGYLMPFESAEAPKRILIPNKGGRVVFSHSSHGENLQIACDTCHHADESPSEHVRKCGDCHGRVFDASFIASHAGSFSDDECSVCHHTAFGIKEWGHREHFDEIGLDCDFCHHEAEDEASCQKCSECHVPQAMASSDASGHKSAIPVLKEAVHAVCIECHEDFFAEGSKACMKCHAASKPSVGNAETFVSDKPLTAPCSDCHSQKISQLIPDAMNAYHAKCIGCHRDMTGPTDKCEQCHIK